MMQQSDELMADLIQKNPESFGAAYAAGFARGVREFARISGRRPLTARGAARLQAEGVIRDFVVERLDLGDGYDVGATVLFRAFGEWQRDRIGDPWTATAFGRAISRVLGKRKSNGCIVYSGARLRVGC